MYASSRKAPSFYANTYLQTSVAEASPHRLIQMLMEGVLARIMAARDAIERGDIATKGDAVSKAITLIGGLDESLDAEKGGEMAENLRGLYQYMTRRLMEANLKTDIHILDEVANLMRQIKLGWDSIPDEYHWGAVAA